MRTRQAGFTLLEVMCAFAILAMITTLITEIMATSYEKVETAIDKRELREIADSVFAKVLYEETEHNDGDSDTLDNAYGRWAQLPQAKRDRYAIYRFVLEKKLTSISGNGAEGSESESMFDSEDTTTTTTSSGDTTAGEDAASESAQLWRYTMHIHLTEDSGDKPLITLQTYRKPSEAALAGNK